MRHLSSNHQEFLFELAQPKLPLGRPLELSVSFVSWEYELSTFHSNNTTPRLTKEKSTNDIQLFPEREVNSGGYTPRREASRYIYPPLFTDPEGDSCFSIYQIRWIKNAASLMNTSSSSETFAKRRAIFLSVRKTVSSQGYSELLEPIKTRENCYPLIW